MTTDTPSIHDLIRNDWNEGNPQWRETTEENWWWMLGCVPPRLHDGNRFLNGEANFDEPKLNWATVYYAGWEYAGKYYARLMTVEQYRDRSNWQPPKEN